MRIGYACLAIAVPGSELKSCTLKNAKKERLLALIEHNLDSLETLIDYNERNGIRLFRISSDLIPFGSSLSTELCWREMFSEKLSAIGQKILRSGMRVSMHPAQYTVLNSPDALVVQRAVEDLQYHAGVLDSLGLGSEHKIILHMGGAYGDKRQAGSRFIVRYQELCPAIKRRLVLENDDRMYNIEDVLATASAAGIPVVYDSLHHSVNPADKAMDDAYWIKLCSETWRKEDGPQKVHYAQQHPGKKPGAHAETIRIDPFLEFWRQLSGMNLDIMLEVKDKNLSALKCINCVSERGIIALEAEWSRYQYCVLERSPEQEREIRRLLRDKSNYPALEMYRRIEESFHLPVSSEHGGNAAKHVWGYFEDKATEAEKRRFQALLRKFSAGETGILPVKSQLRRLAEHYQEDCLLNGYYFYQ
ncbi:MAG: UV DNA damage repair endonuclease UvsE [Oscillospiraceae bacterium]|nr:UV DNA damage repair endonuclease UvsE [Oscillospiraceae bacterium]